MDAQGEARNTVESPLIDLSEFPFEEIAALPESALVHALRRVRAEAEHPEVQYNTNYEQVPRTSPPGPTRE
ncbi:MULTISPECIES: FxSxx-COOH cyclophane-containing RiPP peptide [unclassified Streptomyces]|jgi:FXSXX-COOH protein|uniref:FxSxx-COOH cyclophane-containing RiPP peptide n=1 Tax=Streptomyces thermocoprophilus TaxID=78356 RepID=A0ABV5V7M2_9ACTN